MLAQAYHELGDVAGMGVATAWATTPEPSAAFDHDAMGCDEEPEPTRGVASARFAGSQRAP
jgi:hypothetical protein